MAGFLKKKKNYKKINNNPNKQKLPCVLFVSVFAFI